MGIQALYTAATGMKALDFKLNVVANNLANIETVAFKKSRVNFEDILYRTLEEPGLRNALEQPLPTGQQVGLGVQASGTQLDFTQGSLDQTGQPFDLAVEGEGLFQVQAFIDGQEQTVYTRAGNFTKNANGEIVLANSFGARLEPQITIPQDAVEVQISPNGLVATRAQGASSSSARTFSRSRIHPVLRSSPIPPRTDWGRFFRPTSNCQTLIPCASSSN